MATRPPAEDRGIPRLNVYPAELRQRAIRMVAEVRFAEDVNDRIVFMADGVVVEHGQPAEINHYPHHECTKAFMQRTAASSSTVTSR